MAYKVFISYSTSDLNLATKAKNSLNEIGIDAYVAEYNALPGGILTESIKAAISECDLFLLLWSRKAKDSDWVQQETGIAVTLNKKILPFVLEPNLTPPGFIKDRKYIPAFQGIEPALLHLRSTVMINAGQKDKDSFVIFAGITVLLLALFSSKS